MDTLNLSLHLHTIDELFEAPDENPLKHPGPYESGMETILDELNKVRRVDSIQLTLFLPPDQIEQELESRIKEAIGRYCAFRIRKNEVEMQQTRRIARRQIVSALPFMGIALVLSVLFSAAVEGTTNPAWQLIAGIFATLFSVASWIIVWDPIESLSYGWRPLVTENARYRSLSEAKIVIQSES